MERPSEWQIFVSYSHADNAVVAPLIEFLRISGSEVFKDRDSIKPGARWELKIAESLSSCRTVLLFWSQSASDSKSVEKEYQAAIELGKDVAPILLDDTPLPSCLAAHQHLDFRELILKAECRIKERARKEMQRMWHRRFDMMDRFSAGLNLGSALRALTWAASGGEFPLFSEEESSFMTSVIIARLH